MRAASWQQFGLVAIPRRVAAMPRVYAAMPCAAKKELDAKEKQRRAICAARAAKRPSRTTKKTKSGCLEKPAKQAGEAKAIISSNVVWRISENVLR